MSFGEVLHDAIRVAKVGIDAARADGTLTPAEIWTVAFDTYYRAINLFIAEAAKFVDATGAEKKEQVIVACEKFYNDVLAPIDLPGVPNWFVEPAVDRAVGAMIRPAVSGLIEQLYAYFKLKLSLEVKS